MHRKINDWRPYMYTAIMLVLIFFGTGFIFSKLLNNYLNEQMVQEATTMAELNRYSISTINETMERLERFIEDRLRMVAEEIVETDDFSIIEDYDLDLIEIISYDGVVLESFDDSRIGRKLDKNHAVYLLIENNVDAFFDKNHDDIEENKHYMHYYKKMDDQKILGISMDVKNIYDFTQFDNYVDEILRDDRILSVLIYLSENNESRVYGSGKSSYHLTSDQWESIVKRRTHYKHTNYNNHHALEVHVPIEKEDKVIGSYFIVYSLDSTERFMNRVSFIIAGVLFLVSTVMYGLLRAIIYRNKQIETLSYRDDMTNLYNKTYLKELYENDELDSNKRIVVFFIRNLKRMELLADQKKIRTLINEFVKVLLEVVPNGDIYRYSEESFVVLSESLDMEEVFSKVNSELEIAAGFVSRVNYEDNFFHSIDIANVILENTVETKHVVLEKEVQEEILFLQRIEQDIRELNKKGFSQQMFMVFQPQIDILQNKVVGFEALTRWKHPEYGYIDPQLLFNVALKNDFFFSLNRWVFEESLKFIKEIEKWDITVSINASTRLLESKGFIDRFEKMLQDYDVRPDLVGIEITETEIIDEFSVLEQRINKLSSLGVKIFIDDYGSGYSTLSRLRRLRVDALKIDRSFVSDIGKDDRFVDSILKIANNLGLETVAEGVESDRQLKWLQSNGCKYIQGYYYSKPLRFEQARSYLKEKGGIKDD